MKRRKIIISGCIVILAIVVYGVYYQFLSYDIFKVSKDFQQISNSKYGTYENKGKVDPDVYDSKVKAHAIGKTTNGALIFELKDDPSHKKLIYMTDNMSPMDLFSK